MAESDAGVRDDLGTSPSGGSVPIRSLRGTSPQLLLRAAADTDREAAALWQGLSEERLRGLSVFAHALAR